jgi:hypothetical protein
MVPDGQVPRNGLIGNWLFAGVPDSANPLIGTWLPGHQIESFSGTESGTGILRRCFVSRPRVVDLRGFPPEVAIAYR